MCTALVAASYCLESLSSCSSGLSTPCLQALETLLVAQPHAPACAGGSLSPPELPVSRWACWVLLPCPVPSSFLLSLSPQCRLLLSGLHVRLFWFSCGCCFVAPWAPCVWLRLCRHLSGVSGCILPGSGGILGGPLVCVPPALNFQGHEAAQAPPPARNSGRSIRGPASSSRP